MLTCCCLVSRSPFTPTRCAVHERRLRATEQRPAQRHIPIRRSLRQSKSQSVPCGPRMGLQCHDHAEPRSFPRGRDLRSTSFANAASPADRLLLPSGVHPARLQTCFKVRAGRIRCFPASDGSPLRSTIRPVDGKLAGSFQPLARERTMSPIVTGVTFVEWRHRLDCLGNADVSLPRRENLSR